MAYPNIPSLFIPLPSLFLMFPTFLPTQENLPHPLNCVP